MKIDTHNGWFKGLGDVVCFAWIGATLQAAGADAEFYAHGWHADLLRVFQQRVTEDATGTVAPQESYETAVREKSPLNYLQWIARQLPALNSQLSTINSFQRPRLDLPPMEREMGRKAGARVLVFPEGAWPARVWPRNYYLELCHLLRDAGIDPAIVTEKRAEDFGAFRCIYDQSLAFVAAAVQNAQLVIGNDSGPAHLAGTIGTRALAIHGPTTERIYAHLPEVTSLRKKALACAGCHGLPFDPFDRLWAGRLGASRPPGGLDVSSPNVSGPAAGWRDSCALGCHELYRTFPEDVLKAALKLLGDGPDGRVGRNQKPETRGLDLSSPKANQNPRRK